MIKKIKLLTNIFLKDYYQNLNIINNNNNNLNKKSIFTWLIVIYIVTLIYISQEIITFLQKTGEPILFLKVYLPIIATIMLMNIVALVCRIFYYSKDLEYIIPLPVKTTEILLAKLNTVIIIMYFFELLFLLVPMLMYGILEAKTISFFISMSITMIFFPILYTTIISFIMLLVMKLSKFIKNQDLFQSIVVTVLTSLIIFTEMSYMEKIINEPNQEGIQQIQVIQLKVDDINKYFLTIQPLIEMLDENTFLVKMVNSIKLIIITSIPIIFFVLLGNKLYLKNILQNKNNIKIKSRKKYKYKCKNKIIEYIKKDIKKIIKNPAYFIQYILQYLFTAFLVVILINIFMPIYMKELIESNAMQDIDINEIKLQSTLIVVGILQLIFTFSNLSITAISREGKNAHFLKYIPVSLYKQFKIKALPQIFLNLIVMIMILTAIYLNIPEITIEYYFLTFIIVMILNILNSYITLLIDLKRPNLDWINEESTSKNNVNKLYQYVISIVICLILGYFASIFEGLDFIISILLIIFILSSVLILLKIYIKKNIYKIFKNIN